MIKFQRNELYREIELFDDDIKIGEAEVDVNGRMLSRIKIYEPYQNKGYGTKVIESLCDEFDIDCLWVNADNEKAIHVYEKCGFKVVKPTMYLMERKDAEDE